MKNIKHALQRLAVSKDFFVIDEMSRINIQFGLITTPLIIIFEVIMIALYFGYQSTSEGREPYLVLYFFLLIVSCVSLIAILFFRRSLPRYRKAILWLAHLYAAAVIIWSTALTFLDISHGGDVIVYLTILVVLSAAFYLYPWAAALILGGSGAMLILLTNLFYPSMGITINLSVFTVFMVLVSMIRYATKKENICNERLVKEQNKELNRLNEQLNLLSKTDMLTKLHNRWHYDQISPQLLHHCVQGSHPLTAFLIDIDEFKKVNDTFGHKTGDESLCSVASIIDACSRRCGGTAFRFGGEEFLVLLPNCDQELAMQLAEEIRFSVEQATVRGVPYPITVSIGCFSDVPCDGDEVDRFVAYADQAMYRAKNSGKNRVVSTNRSTAAQ